MPMVGNVQYGLIEAPFNPFIEGQRLVILKPPMFLRRLFPWAASSWPKFTPLKTCENILRDVVSPYATYGICKIMHDAREKEPIHVDIRELEPKVDHFRDIAKMLEFWGDEAIAGLLTQRAMNVVADTETPFLHVNPRGEARLLVSADNRCLNEDGKIHHTI